jgi:hypothetical protein
LNYGIIHKEDPKAAAVNYTNRQVPAHTVALLLHSDRPLVSGKATVTAHGHPDFILGLTKIHDLYYHLPTLQMLHCSENSKSYLYDFAPVMYKSTGVHTEQEYTTEPFINPRRIIFFSKG